MNSCLGYGGDAGSVLFGDLIRHVKEGVFGVDQETPHRSIKKSHIQYRENLLSLFQALAYSHVQQEIAH